MPELTAQERRRLAVLRDYGVLDTAPEAELDEIVTLASEICGAPMALITLIDESRQWFKARLGFEQTETAREFAFCDHALHGPDILVVPDATQDERFADNPLVRDTPRIRFYAGAALVTPEGERLGTLCVLDRRRRELTTEQQRALRILSRHVMAHLELARRLRAQQRSEAAQRELAAKLERERRRLIEAQAVAKVGSWETDLHTMEVTWSEETHRIFHTDPASFRPTHQSFLQLVHPDDRGKVDQAFAASAGIGEPCVIEHRLLLPGETEKIVEERWQVFLDQAGRPLRAIGTCRDITEQRKLEQDRSRLVHDLGERVKELNALHLAADLLRELDRPLAEMLGGIANILPPAMQHPHLAAARVVYGDSIHATANWRESTAELRSEFRTLNGVSGVLQVVYLGSAPAEAERPFLAEERKLVDSLAEMLRATIDRRDAESVMHELQRRQSLILDSVSEGIHGLDQNGCIVFENAAGAAMLGWKQDELIGRHSHTVIHHHRADGSDYPVCECPIYRTLRDGVTRRIDDEVFFRKDGNPFPVEYTCSPIRDSAGAIKGAVVSFRDISHRRESEQHLENLRRLARMASRLGRIGAWEVSLPEGRTFWSDEVRALHEVASDFVPTVDNGLTFYTLETREHLRTHFLRCVTEGVPFDIEAQIESARGRRLWVRVMGEAVRNSVGEIVRVQGAFQDIEESKRAAQELIEARVLHTNLVNSIDGIVWEAAAGTLKFTFVSQQAERILGYPIRAWLDDADFWPRHIHPDERDEIVRYCLEATQRKENHTFEYRMLAADGRIVWIRDIVAYVEVPDRPAMLRGIMLDITALKEAEAQSRQMETRLVTTLENITDAFFTLDGEWRFTFVNHEAERLLKRPREELIGRNVWDEFPEARGSLFEEHYQHAVQTRQSVTFESYYPPLETWFEVRAHPSEFGLAVHFRDINERRAAAEQLRLSEERFRHTFFNAPIGMALVSTEGRFLQINTSFCRMLGFTETEMIGRSIVEITHPDDRAITAQEMRHLREGGKDSYSIEKRYLDRGGNIIWCRVGVTALRDDAGQMRHYIGTVENITESRAAAERLRESEERFREMAENIGDVFYNYDPISNRLLYANRAYESIWGRPLDWIYAHPTGYLDDIHPEDRAIAERALTDQLRGKKTDVDFRIVRPDGAIRWIREHASPVVDASGRVERIVGTMRDVTERRAIIDQLREGEERFRLLAKATYDAVWDWNLVTETVWWNEGYEQLFGHRHNEIDSPSKTWTDMIHPDDRDRVIAGIDAILAGDAVDWADEYRFRRRDGTYVPVADRGEVLRDSAGKAVRMIGGMTDLTERKRAEEKLREQAALLDQAKDAIIVRDLDHRILYWNKSAERYYGWTAADAIGRSINELLYADPSAFLAATAQVLAQGEWNGEIEQFRRDGTPLIVEGRWTLLRDEKGRPKSVLAINTDVTERKKLEQQFLRAQRMESIGTLAGGIAHDLNNLLAPITMGVELLRRYEPNAKAKPIIDNIERSARRGSDLVKQVLSFARGVEGARVAMQVRHVVREIESIVENTFPKNIIVETYLPDALWLVTGDPTQLNQILLNLCVNARDAMPNGGTLTLRADNTDIDEQYAVMNRGVSPGRYVALSVTDTGIGMPREVIDRIFDPFFTTKEIGKGTGLGLSTVLGIVRSHGGFVNVYSEPGKGSTFKVYLPAQEGAAAGDPVQSEAEKFPRGNGELILIVDDEASILDITKQTLEAFGYRVITAEDGAQAIGQFALARDQVAVVLTDMMMPVMDGPSLIVALKRIDPQVRIIAASGLNANGNVAKAANVGVKHFLPKPYSADTLLTTLRQVIAAPDTRPPM